MTDTGIQSISYIRPGRTKKDGVTVPTGLRVTYNLVMPKALAEKYPIHDLDDAQKEDLIDVLFAEGASYIEEETQIPGYVLSDEATHVSTHWRFFADNKMTLVVHQMENGDALGVDTSGKTSVRLNDDEVNSVITEMKQNYDIGFSLFRERCKNHKNDYFI